MLHSYHGNLGGHLQLGLNPYRNLEDVTGNFKPI